MAIYAFEGKETTTFASQNTDPEILFRSSRPKKGISFFANVHGSDANTRSCAFLPGRFFNLCLRIAATCRTSKKYRFSRQTYQNPLNSKCINTSCVKIYLEICLNCKRCRS
jgi:hypothetical protein